MNRDTLGFGRPLDEVRGSFSPEEHDLFADLLEEVRSLYGTRLRSLKLVGSRARGTAMERSDYDFLILLDACDYGVEVPRLQSLGYDLSLKHGLGSLSLSPLSEEQFLGLDGKYQGITDCFRRDAVTIWP
jgi:predicted nucleotidyltransferase